MKRFSIQAPETRSNLDEWLFHELLQSENILTPNYSFIDVTINGENKGTYAIEEHFDKNLLEKQNRREGPILKLAEEGFWKTQLYINNFGKDPKNYVPVFEAAPIEAFQDGRTLDDSLLRKMYLDATTQLDNWRYGRGDLSEVIDFEKYARFFALSDLMQGYHALRWHNLRFYYNPMDGLLEPVVYDSYTSAGVYSWFNKELLGNDGVKGNISYYREEYLIFQLFNSVNFRKLYTESLKKYSSESFIDSFIENSISKSIILQSQFPSLSYNFSRLKDRANNIRQNLEEYSQQKHELFEYQPFIPNYNPCQLSTPIDKVSLIAYPIEGRLRNEIQLFNYHCQNLYIVGCAPKKKKPVYTFDPPIKLEKSFISNLPPVPEIIELPQKHDWLFYKTHLDSSQLYRIKVSDWPRLEKINDDHNESFFPDDWITISQDTVFLKPGDYKINKLYIYNGQRHFKIQPNTSIELDEGGGLLFKSPITVQGRENQIVHIFSKTSNSYGFNIVNAKGISTINQVKFQNLYPINAAGIHATGGVHIYNSPVNISGCHFFDFNSEDALNIVSTESVNIENSLFENCLSDAMDLDFSASTVKNIKITNVKGDGLDISGGRSSLEKLELTTITDKGLSIGENAFVALKDIIIDNSTIGIAFKEGVYAEGSKLKIMDCEYGVIVFRKKNIFPYAQVTLNDFQCNNNCIQVEFNHQVIINGVKITSDFEDGHFSNLLY
jgi:hypothetical protein